MPSERFRLVIQDEPGKGLRVLFGWPWWRFGRDRRRAQSVHPIYMVVGDTLDVTTGNQHGLPHVYVSYGVSSNLPGVRPPVPKHRLAHLVFRLAWWLEGRLRHAS